LTSLSSLGHSQFIGGKDSLLLGWLSFGLAWRS
jgi:hypothetical protein